MARYAKVHRSIWLDARFRSLTERGKLVFLFLLTHPGMTMLGAMRATIPGLAAELEMPIKAFQEAFRETLSRGIAKYDLNSSLLWFPNFLKYNKPESPNVVRAWPDAFELIPECSLKGHIFEQLEAFTEGLSEGFRQAFKEVFLKPSGSLTEALRESVTVAGTGAVTEAVTEEKTIVESSASDQLPGLPLRMADSLEDLLVQGFAYFLEQTGHHADQYQLDEKRRAMGLAGFREVVKFVRGRDPNVDPLPLATTLFRLAVDRLVKSKFHSGENAEGKRYWEWHHLFKAKEFKSPTKLIGYWLNDNNFREQTGRRSA
jgi:hypothetical protein